MNKGLKGAGFAIFILLFLLAAILTAVLPESSRKAENAIALPDGRLLRLEAVTFGTSHEYRTGPEWLQKLQKMSPGWLRDKLGPEVRSLHMHGKNGLHHFEVAELSLVRAVHGRRLQVRPSKARLCVCVWS